MVLLFCSVTIFAQQPSSDYFPQTTEDFSEQSEQLQKLLNITPFEVLQQGWESISKMTTSPFKIFCNIAVFLLFAAVVSTPTDTGEKPFLPVIEMICFLVCAVLCVAPIQQTIEQVTQQIIYCKGALIGFVPIFSSMLIGGGQPASAAIFSGFFMSTALLLMEIAVGIVLPLIQILMAFHTASGACGIGMVSATAQFVQKVIKWSLGLITTVFCTFLGLQNFVAGASDSLAMKTGKFLISSSIPIVGQAVSGTISAVSAGIKVAKGTAGIGLLAVLGGYFLPVLIKIVLYWMCFSVAASIAKGLEQKRCEKLLRASAECVSLCGLTLLFYGLPIALSVVWMMTSGG